MAHDILQGLQSFEKLVKEHNVQGVLGPLIDIIECRESMRKCIEVCHSRRTASCCSSWT